MAEAREAQPFLSRLRRDTAGNTLTILTAGLFPLLALVGGGVDMGRNYLSQTRLQQACDAGVLAARKQLGSQVVLDGMVPADVATVGNRFFNLNFHSGVFGTEDRTFQMTLEPDYAISGVATVTVPTTVMSMFGFEQTDLRVVCQANLSFSNTDVMMVLDTTGSMAWTNPGDSQPRIDILRQTVKDFYAQVQATKTPGTRIRYGFLPYSSNVNVGGILKPEWMVDKWTYNSRLPYQTGTITTAAIYQESWTHVSGDEVASGWSPAASCPANTKTSTPVGSWSDPDGTQHWEYILNGVDYECGWADAAHTQQIVSSKTYNDYRYIYNLLNKPATSVPVMTWRYQPVTVDVSSLKQGGALNVGAKIAVPNMGGTPYSPAPMDTWFRGCIEERDTYQISDYTNVDFSQAPDLDIDLVPTPSNPATQWRPALSEIQWLRIMKNGGDWASLSVAPANSDDAVLNARDWQADACPQAARKLAEMSAGEISAYVDSLYPLGGTYHDIGMIWGARMLSPTGLFAAENEDVNGVPTSRHMIFLTDGVTDTGELIYSSYGIEALDLRRWQPGSSQTQNQVVENRIGVACEEAKKRNITVWVIGFGTALNPVLTQCAGPGHSFEATNAGQLQAAFSKIAASLGNLRVTK